MLRKVPAVIDNMGVVKMRIIATFCIVAFYVAPTVVKGSETNVYNFRYWLLSKSILICLCTLKLVD